MSIANTSVWIAELNQTYIYSNLHYSFQFKTHNVSLKVPHSAS